MGKPVMLFITLLVVTLASEGLSRHDGSKSSQGFSPLASASGGCPAGKGVCVDSWNCKSGKLINSKQHKCILPNEKRGVCCDVECTTSRGGPGKCAAAEQCNNYTRDFVLERNTLNEAQWWKEPSTECQNVTKSSKIYCCPIDQPDQKHDSKLKKNATTGKENGFPSCQTTRNHPGRSVPLDLCDHLYDECRRMPGYRRILNSKCRSTVCCRNPQNPDDFIRHAKAIQLGLDQCGKISMTDKILGGNKADLGQFPWMANIMYHRKDEYNVMRKVTLCSGSLIHPKYVLTTAHCSKPGSRPISVRLGEYDLSKEKDCVEGRCAGRFIERSIEKWISHEKYRSRTGEYDIALVKLDPAAKIIQGQISPICLPLTEQWLMTKPSQLTVSGWGMMENQRLPDVLMHADLQLVNNHTICLHEDVICARGVHKEGNCQGDSGGPLQKIMRLGNNKYRMVLFGVISGGAPECSKKDNTPGVSMLVGYYLRWILDKMEI